jgi:pimeloyl-ACP methyl ester carboxylesterase
MGRMDLPYVVALVLLVLLGILVAVLCFRRIFSRGIKKVSTSRRIAECVGLSLIALVALAAGASGGVNAILLHRYRAHMPGSLYEVDGHRMHLDCAGSGSPALILDAGLGNDALIWSAVQPRLAKTTRVCSYDRAGMGWSDPAPTPRDADHIAVQLHGLLESAGIHGPIILMGHSIAGIYIRDYTQHYRDQVAGLVFVDASTPLQNRDPAFAPHMRAGGPPLPQVLITEATFILGIPRWFGACSQNFPGFSPARARLQAEVRCHMVVSSPVGESRNFDRSGQETVQTGPWGDLPILVLSSDPARALAARQPKAVVDAWTRMQANLKNLSTHSRQIIARGSGHYIQLDRPDLIDRELPLFIEQIRGAAPQPVWGTTTTE